jgi:16S rRNA (guanine966-N2)-methyltransferase
LASSLYATGGLDGARILDLYAGSGALGLELVSRGASSAVFVEHDRAALTALRANITALGPSAPDAELTVIPGDVAAFAARSAGGGKFDVLVADPPYDLTNDALADVLAGLHRAGLLAPHADLVIERGRKSGPPEWPDPLEGVRTKKYGDTLLCYGRAP